MNIKLNIKKANISILYFSLFILTLTSCKNQVKEKEESYIKYVNPLIGTSGHGHTCPGSIVPFGMLQVSPDNGIAEWDLNPTKIG